MWGGGGSEAHRERARALLCRGERGVFPPSCERERELFCAPLSSRFARGVGVARHRRHSFVRFLLVQAARIGQPSQADLSYLALVVVVVVVVLRKQNNKVPRLAPRTVGQ